MRVICRAVILFLGLWGSVRGLTPEDIELQNDRIRRLDAMTRKLPPEVLAHLQGEVAKETEEALRKFKEASAQKLMDEL